MNYILTEEEFANLVPKIERDNLRVALGIARERILFHSKFPCIHDPDRQNEYCDLCPCRVKNGLSKLCLLDKNYSR